MTLIGFIIRIFIFILMYFIWDMVAIKVKNCTWDEYIDKTLYNIAYQVVRFIIITCFGIILIELLRISFIPWL